MRTFWILWKREITTFFRTPRAMMVMVLFLLLMGFNFYTGVGELNHISTKVSIVEIFFNTPLFWISFLALIPLITMALFSEEYQTGSFETLMTAPVRVTQVLLAKFFSAFVFLALLFVPTLFYFILFWPSAHQIAAAGYGAYLGAYGMLLLLGMLYLSIGCFTSSLTSHQLIACMLSLTIIGVMFLLTSCPLFLNWIPSSLHHLVPFISPKETMIAFSRGLIDTRPIVSYFCMTFFFLFLTAKALQWRR